MRGVGSRRLVAGCLIVLGVIAADVPAWGEAPTCSGLLAAAPAAAASLSLDPRESDGLKDFYVTRNDRCAWSDATVKTLSDALATADSQALDPARYHPDAIRGATQAATRDLYATAMALRYAHDLVFGRVDLAKLDDDVDVPRPADDLGQQLEHALTQPTIAPWLAGLAPSEPGYRRLLEAYRRLRARPAAPDPDPIDPGPVLKLGASGPRVTALQARLHELGDLRDGANGPEFDAATRDALAAFQRRHGLTDDGKLTRETTAALDVADSERLRRIALNLERWRYFGHALAASRIEVNTAAATFALIEDGRVAMAMRAVVGDPRHHSPMLVSSGIDAIIVNPTWYVPESIVAKEIRPHIEQDPDYLETNEMHWDGDRLLQSPGARNSLGRIKFDFPSPFAVYLHDTPAHSYFARANRQLSHGCIRLEKPRDLALKLLSGDDKWTEASLKKAIDRGTTEKIDVPAGPQVALVYWTAFVDEDGTLEFRNDVYGRDARLETALGGGAPVATRIPVRIASRRDAQRAAP